MKILFMAPLPPPVNGHSLAAKVFLDGLQRHHEVAVVDLGVDSAGDGSLSPGRIKSVMKLLGNVWRRRRGVDVSYLTISESLFGNLKDLVIYCMCWRKLRQMYIHLHGGSIELELFRPHPMIRRINAFFIRRMAGAIISGRSHADIFARMLPPEKIFTSVNFAQDELFVDESHVRAKFARLEPLKLIFISNMIAMKGFDELADAILSLDPATRSAIEIEFAGRFDSETNRMAFEQKIAGQAGIRYHGIVDGNQKVRMFGQAHVFVLPTAFKEGQPISILEAYASGCVVVTTKQPGIRDVFTPGVNGFEVAPRNAVSIAEQLRHLVARRGELESIALTNCRTAAADYRIENYNRRLVAVVEGRGREAGLAAG